MPGSQVNTSTSTGCVTTLEAGLLQDLPAPRRRTDGQENTGAVTNFNLIGHDQDHGVLDSNFVKTSRTPRCNNCQEMVPFDDLVMLHRMEGPPPEGRMEPSW